MKFGFSRVVDRDIELLKCVFYGGCPVKQQRLVGWKCMQVDRFIVVVIVAGKGIVIDGERVPLHLFKSSFHVLNVFSVVATKVKQGGV